jgi:ABC-type multidrug transport system fused ATPase/permease subunit
MLKMLKEIYLLLDSSQKKSFFIIQVLIIFSSVLEVMALAFLALFVSVINSINFITSNKILNFFYTKFYFSNEYDFIFLIGIFLLIFYFFSTLVSILINWRLIYLSQLINVHLSNLLYSYFMKQNWLFHMSSGISGLNKSITNDLGIITSRIIQPFFFLLHKIFIVFAISAALFFLNPLVAIVGFFVFLIIYLILFKFVRKIIKKNTQGISSQIEEQYKVINDGFSGIKEIILLGLENHFINIFAKTGRNIAYPQALNLSLSQLPRFFVEMISYSGVIIFILVFVKIKSDLGVVLPTIAIYAFAGLKLLPAFQQIYNSLINMKGGQLYFNSVKGKLKKSFEDKFVIRKNINKKKYYPFKKELILKNVYFKYPEKNKPALNNIDIKIKSKKIIGIAGHTGSGKSTILDIILGLIQPTSGKLTVDGKILNNKALVRKWQNNFGFVPQNIYLSNSTIIQNIAFGIPEKNINLDKVKAAAKLANIDKFIEQLPQKFHTMIGDRGVRFSGGERQRIGIARSLYFDPSILIFDEATNALDSFTEKLILKAIKDISKHKTIIIVAHRLNTLKICDNIFLIDSGKLIAQGNYNSLIKYSKDFRKLAKN